MKRYSYSIFITSILLFGLGLLILMSASSQYAIISRDNLFAIFTGQLFKGLGGIVLMILFAAVPYQVLKSASKWLLLAIIIVLIITRVAMPEVNNVHRWFVLGSFRFQPAEFAKLFLFIHLAKLLAEKKDVLHDLKEGYAYPVIWTIIVGGLVIAQPSVSNAIIIFSVSFCMIMLAGARWKHLFVTFLAGAAPITLIALVMPYARLRITKFLAAIFTGQYEGQVRQAMIGLGSGGFYGRGIGNSWQRNLHLPEAYGDFIFSIAGEELGFIGTLLIVLAFFLIFFIGIIIAKNAKDMFGQLLAFGISGFILMHVLIHIGVSVGLMPPTGIPLPFISHGGTSLIVIFIALGILMNIGFSNAKEAEVVEASDTVEEQVQPT
ncbi:MAG: FtsW/RodA/SpoVE family cell cycle protein [Ignavibacteriales bacterium]|nr:FtsW/RodA/SpoVE family cell cycle protein [Ignavibacteriales bacterium]